MVLLVVLVSQFIKGVIELDLGDGIATVVHHEATTSRSMS